MKKEFLIDEHTEEIAQLEKDLREHISFDEWSAREYGVDSIDYYSTAINLIEAGYMSKRERHILQKAIWLASYYIDQEYGTNEAESVPIVLKDLGITEDEYTEIMRDSGVDSEFYAFKKAFSARPL